MKVETDAFEAKVLQEAAVRAQMDAFLEQVEKQRLIAWVNWQAQPDGVMEGGKTLKNVYKDLCGQQRRLTAAIKAWQAAHPELVEDAEESES